MAKIKQKVITFEQAKAIIEDKNFVVIDNDRYGLWEVEFQYTKRPKGKLKGLYVPTGHFDDSVAAAKHCLTGTWSLERTKHYTMLVLTKADGTPVFDGTILRYDVTIERLLKEHE